MSESKLRKPYQVPDITTISFLPERGVLASGAFLMEVYVPEVQTIEYRDNTGGYFGDAVMWDEETWF